MGGSAAAVAAADVDVLGVAGGGGEVVDTAVAGWETAARDAALVVAVDTVVALACFGRPEIPRKNALNKTPAEI